MATKGISFKQFGRITPHIVRSRKPIMGHGAHGIGKSQVVYQMADALAGILGPDFEKKYGKDYVFPVVERRASQMADTGDVIGVPEVNDTDLGRVTSFAPLGWFAQACNEPCILFFDEVDRANNDVRQSLMELTDSRKIAGFTLHPDTIIIAMVNGGVHDENNAYQVSEMDPAENDRWWHVNLQPTVEDWLTWAKGKVQEVTYDFIAQNKMYLEHSGDFEPNKVYPTRRSWDHFDKALRNARDAGCDLLAPDETGKINMDVYFIGEGFVGQEASIAYRDFVENYNKMVTVDDILAGRKQNLIKDFKVNDSNAMVDKIATDEKIKNGLNKEQIKNLAIFCHAIQAELVMKAWEKLTKVSPDVVKVMWNVKVNGDETFGHYLRGVIGVGVEDES